MKILYVITQLGVGGAEVVLVSMANKMVELGHQVEIVSLLNINTQKFDDKIDVHVLDLKNNSIHASMQFIKIIKNFNPDVVHSHCLHANIITRFYRLFCPMKRLITTAHNTYEGQGLIMSIFKYTNFLSNVVTNVSTDAVLAFEKSGYVKHNQMKVMFNIINIDKFEFSQDLRDEYRNKFKINEDEQILISVGSMKDSKDYPNLLSAIQLVKERVTKKFRVFVVGDGDLMGETQQLASELGVKENISFLGVRNDVNALLSMADIFVLSSKHEGLPTVLIEAAMAKNLIISTDCGGIDDILPTRENVVAIQNPLELAEKIVTIIQASNEETNQQIEKTYLHVKEVFNSNKIAKHWLNIYQDRLK